MINLLDLGNEIKLTENLYVGTDEPRNFVGLREDGWTEDRYVSVKLLMEDEFKRIKIFKVVINHHEKSEQIHIIINDEGVKRKNPVNLNSGLYL